MGTINRQPVAAAPTTRPRLSNVRARTLETFAFWQVNSGGFDANVQTWDFLVNVPLVFDQFTMSPPEMAGRQIEVLTDGVVVASGVLVAGAQLSLSAPVTVGTGKTLRVRLTRTADGDVYVGQRDTLPAGAAVAGGALKFVGANTNNYAPAMRWALGADMPKSVDGPLDASDFPVVTSLDQLLPGQAALLDNGTDPPRLVRKRLDGTLTPLASEDARYSPITLSTNGWETFVVNLEPTTWKIARGLDGEMTPTYIVPTLLPAQEGHRWEVQVEGFIRLQVGKPGTVYVGIQCAGLGGVSGGKFFPVAGEDLVPIMQRIPVNSGDRVYFSLYTLAAGGDDILVLPNPNPSIMLRQVRL
ncbi:hypothetical protein [Deinococcus sp. Leaf326]|uniref:hypothetical protein n=1 Tax=Deinococcus sp. Leaf326 TaxID=1736338 RepID=UPI0006F7C4A7|nr:hypothetical protein [Deinococcus sp. Leaf326]KQR37717.1 hypothetical protein ASF71_14650 [Deinococcus sp. Leaf326]